MARSNHRVFMVPLIATMLIAAACSKNRGSKSVEETPQVKSNEVQNRHTGSITISAGKLPTPDDKTKKIFLPNGGFINIVQLNGQLMVPVEGTVSEDSFQQIYRATAVSSANSNELAARLREPLQETTKILTKEVGLTDISEYPIVAYFRGLMPLTRFDQLAAIKGLPANLVMSPVVSYASKSLVRKMDADVLDGLSVDPRTSTDAYSGLLRMGVPEFERLVRADVEQAVDGSSVQVGVADTGVTLNHPAFTDTQGHSRVKYLKDFTTEGKAFINPQARFEVTVPTQSLIPDEVDPAQILLVTAEILPPQVGAGAVPQADGLVLKENLQILVNPELRAILTTPDSGAKLAFISERSFASNEEKVDLNMNGKLDDNLAVILVPSGDGYKVYFDRKGEMDFRNATGIGAFNTTGETLKLVSEKIGFDIRSTELEDSTGNKVPVILVAIVGYDPGNHGSHVSGIIAGRKTIANDQATTLARGAVPNANLMVNRVCANNGGCFATEAIIDLALNGAEIVNMSLGGLSALNDEYGVENLVIDRLTTIKNTLFVISAGNSGPGTNTVGSPSTSRLSLSVGATATNALLERQYQWPGTGELGPKLGPVDRDQDFVLFFSSRGPTASGGFKPNIAAPGTELSSVQLNTAPGARAGLDVYWGTSMAAPAATGAIALLLDAAKKYNATHENPLPTDALTLRKVIIASARPFNVTTWNTETGVETKGLYGSWIDQGAGMINLPRAWVALKAERDTRIPSAVFIEDEGKHIDVALDYLPRVATKMPNGGDYTGAVQVSPTDATMGRRLGTGLWIDAKDARTLYDVQIARRLPLGMVNSEYFGELRRQLVTSADSFHLETVIYGSNKPWVKAGTLEQPNCAESLASELTILGEGAIDAENGTTSGIRASNLNVCIDREILAALPAGDHGALIKAYKIADGLQEKNPSFIVPVYVAIPHHTLAASAAYEAQGIVQAFGVARNYVRIPEGTNLVTVTVEVPEAATKCQGLRALILEGGNTNEPEEMQAPKNTAANCSRTGVPSPQSRKVTYTRNNPRPGIWDVHVFGLYYYPETQYKVRVDFAKIHLSKDKIMGGITALNDSLEYTVIDASTSAVPDAALSTIALAGFGSEKVQGIDNGAQISPSNPEGKTFRQYDDSVASATITTDGAAGNDIDLVVFECDDESMEHCTEAGSSLSSTAVEKVTFTPNTAKYYIPVLTGYDIIGGHIDFTFGESLTMKSGDQGSVQVSGADGHYVVAFAMNTDEAKILKDARFTSGLYHAIGRLGLVAASGAELTSIPVEIDRN